MGSFANAVKQIDWAGLFLPVLVVGWVFGVPLLLAKAFLTSLNFGDTALTAAQVDATDTLLAWAAICAIGLPVLGTLIAVGTSRRGYAWFFGLALVLAACVIAFCLAHSGHPQRTPQTPPSPAHCVEHSGGGNECPGD